MSTVAEKVKQIEAIEAGSGALAEPESTRVIDASESPLPPSDDEAAATEWRPPDATNSTLCSRANLTDSDTSSALVGKTTAP